LENQADNEDFSQVLWTRLLGMPAWAEGVSVFVRSSQGQNHRRVNFLIKNN